jgi:ribA/ribD-fused uncharacterized protein
MIKEFQGEYRWLSNFAPVEINYMGRIYPSVEHAYQSAKSNDDLWKAMCQDPAISAGKIKRESRRVKLRIDWDKTKWLVMADCVLEKFTQEPYHSKLIATGDKPIQEGNTWGDTYWGVDLETGEGMNELGRIIMHIRKLLIKEQANKTQP